MSAPQQFSLKWNNFSQHIVTAFEDLRGDEEFTDVTLSCEGKRIKCHKVLLSICSPYFKETFRETPCKHPVIILKGIEFVNLQAIVNFMYNGQVNVSQERLSTFLQTAELLQIKGLTETNDKEDSPKSSSQGGVVSSTGPSDMKFYSRNPLSSDLKPPPVTSFPRRPVPKRRRIGPASVIRIAHNNLKPWKQLSCQPTMMESLPHKVANETQNSFHDPDRFHNEDLIIDEIPEPDDSGPVVAGYSGDYLGADSEIIMPSSDVPMSVQMSTSHQENFYSINQSLSPEHTSEDYNDDYVKYDHQDLSEDSLNDAFGEMENGDSMTTPFLTDGSDVKTLSSGSEKLTNGPFTPVEGEAPTFIATKRGYKIKYDNYLYTKDKAIYDKEYWRCIHNQKYKCKGRLLLLNDQICGTKPHNEVCLNSLKNLD